MNLKYRVGAIAAACLIIAGVSAHGIEAAVPSMVIPAFYLILVVSVESISPAPHTSENPPCGTFIVHEIIRGHFKEKRVAFRWWGLSEPVPQIGEKVITLAQMAPIDERRAAHFALSDEPALQLLRVRGIFAYTEENIATLRQHMGRTDWPPFVMRSLWLVVVVLAIGAAGILLTSFSEDVGVHTRRLRLGGSLFVTSLVLWLLFEYGNVTGGIRVDLLFLLPLFFSVASVFLGACVVLTRHRKAPGSSRQGNAKGSPMKRAGLRGRRVSPKAPMKTGRK